MAENTKAFKAPVLKEHVITDGREKYQEILDIEDKVFEYKVKTEHAMAIYDELSKYFDFGSIPSEFDITHGLSIKYGLNGTEDGLTDEEKENNAFLRDVKSKSYDTQLTSFLNFFKKDKKNVLKNVLENLRNKISSKYENEGEKMMQIHGLANKIKVDLMVFLKLISEVDQIKEQNKDILFNYGISQKDGIRKYLSLVNPIKKGIKIIQQTRNSEVMQSNETIANNIDFELDEVNDFDNEFNDVFKEVLGFDLISQIEKKHTELGDIVGKEFIPAYANYHDELKGLYKMLHEGRIVETEYIRETISEVLPSLRKNPPTIVYLHGDFGTGKTALATHIAKTRILGDRKDKNGKPLEPTIVSGSKFLEPDRFTEDFRMKRLDDSELFSKIAKKMNVDDKLSGEETLDVVFSKLIGLEKDLYGKISETYQNSPDVIEKVKEEYETSDKKLTFEEYRKRNPVSKDVSESIKEKVSNLFDNKVQGVYVLGDMYKCMVEGRPLIIDEANAITPEVMIAFNDLLTKKIGDKIVTRTEFGEIEVKEGYCVMWTGNTGERYKNARYQNIDPASLSRIHPVKVKYLPNSREVNQGLETNMERLGLDKISDLVSDEMDEKVKDSKDKAKNDEIFQVLMIKLLNRRLGTELLSEKKDRYSTIKDMYKLATGARLIMDIFEGVSKIDLSELQNIKDKDNKSVFGTANSEVIKSKLQKTNLSMRDLMDNIIGGYLDDGCSMDVEYYLYKYVKKQEFNPEEQVIVYSVLKRAGLFNSSEGWPDMNSIKTMEEFSEKLNADGFKTVTKYKEIKENGNSVRVLSNQDENGEYKYHYQYFSSIEMMQIIYGYLPARKASEYDDMKSILFKENEEENIEEDELDEISSVLDEKLSGIIDQISDENFVKLFKDTQETVSFKEKIDEFLNGIEKLGKNDLITRVDNLINYILEIIANLQEDESKRKSILELSKLNNLEEKIEEVSKLLSTL